MLQMILDGLRAKENFNCLFVEKPVDLQENVTRAISENNFPLFEKIIMKGSESSTIRTYTALNAPKETMSQLRTYLENGKLNPTYAINESFLSYLHANRIQVFAYDAPSESEEVFRSVYLRFLDLTQPRDPNRDIETYKAINKRNEIMSANIKSKLSGQECDRALVVVGDGHLQEFNFPGVLNVNALQSRLQSLGSPGAVVLLRKGNSSENLSAGLMSEDTLPAGYKREWIPKFKALIHLR